MALIMKISLLVTVYLLLLPSCELTDDKPLSGILRANAWNNPGSCRIDFEKMSASCGYIDAVPQDLWPNIRTLNLSWNSIAVLHNTSFQRYPYLTTLDLSYNSVHAIEIATFSTLKRLTYLNLCSVSFVFPINIGILQFVSKLTYLHMGFCHLDSFPNEVLQWHSHLEFFHVSSNSISYVDVTSCGEKQLQLDLSSNNISKLTNDTFKISCKLDCVDITGNHIKRIDQGVLADLPISKLQVGEASMTLEIISVILKEVAKSDIKELKIVDVDLSAVPTNLFDVLHNMYLCKLHLSHTHIDHLSSVIFRKLNNITTLSLDGNSIPIITPESFTGMEGLLILELNSNQIENINPSKSNWNLNITELYLTKNNFREINQFAFYGLVNVTYLDLSHNYGLSILNFTSFTGLSNLRVLNVSFTTLISLSMHAPLLKQFAYSNALWTAYIRVVFIPGVTFKYEPFLEAIDLSNSRLMVKEIWDSRQNQSLFHGLYHLENLYLNGNYLNNLPVRTFERLISLHNLSLRGCEISNLVLGIFSGLRSLRTLDLRGNKIAVLPSGLFADLHALQFLDLYHNSLYALGDNLFVNTSALKTLLLSTNQLTSLNHTTFIPIMSELTTLDLSRNELACECHLKWLVDWLRGPMHISNNKATTCFSAQWDPVVGIPLLSFEVDRFCGINATLYCSVSLGLLLLCTVLTLIYQYRWTLRYQLILLKLSFRKRGGLAGAPDKMDYEFDLNVLFAEDDEEWVNNQLKPTLHQKLPSFDKNVFGDADLYLGMHYLDAVNYAIENSFKTILLLSRASVRDNWFLMKFRSAMDYHDRNKTQNIAVIFLESIPDEEVPYCLRLYLSDNKPYLRWGDNDRGQEFFWKELMEILTFNLKDDQGLFHL